MTKSIEQEKTCQEFLRWLIKQQYYIIHPNLRKKIKEILQQCEEKDE